MDPKLVELHRLVQDGSTIGPYIWSLCAWFVSFLLPPSLPHKYLPVSTGNCRTRPATMRLYLDMEQHRLPPNDMYYRYRYSTGFFKKSICVNVYIQLVGIFDFRVVSENKKLPTTGCQNQKHSVYNDLFFQVVRNQFFTFVLCCENTSDCYDPAPPRFLKTEPLARKNDDPQFKNCHPPITFAQLMNYMCHLKMKKIN